MRLRFENKDRPLLPAAAAILVVIVFGTSGYYFLEGWSFIDSFFMTVITLSTVGYEEVNRLDTSGKVFTAVLILAGVGVVAYSLSTMVRLVVEGEFYRTRVRRKMKRRIAQMSGHTIVCGYGLLGKIVVRELLNAKEDVVVIDHDPDKVSELEQGEICFVDGVAHDDDVLAAAGIDRARTLISLLPHDADSVFVTLCAREMNPKLTIVARTEDEGSEKQLLRAGANKVFTPYRLAGSRLVQQLINPGATSFLDVASSPSSGVLAIEEIMIPLDSKLAGKTLEVSQIRQKTGAVVVAFIEPNGNMVFNPGAQSVITPGYTMIIFGEKGSLAKVAELL